MNTKYVFQHKTARTDYGDPEYVVCAEGFSFFDFIEDGIPQFKKAITAIEEEAFNGNTSDMRYYVKERGIRTGEAYKLISSEQTDIDIS